MKSRSPFSSLNNKVVTNRRLSSASGYCRRPSSSPSRRAYITQSLPPEQVLDFVEHPDVELGVLEALEEAVDVVLVDIPLLPDVEDVSQEPAEILLAVLQDLPLAVQVLHEAAEIKADLFVGLRAVHQQVAIVLQASLDVGVALTHDFTDQLFKQPLNRVYLNVLELKVHFAFRLFGAQVCRDVLGCDLVYSELVELRDLLQILFVGSTEDARKGHRATVVFDFLKPLHALYLLLSLLLFVGAEEELPTLGQQIGRGKQVLMVRIGSHDFRIGKLGLIVDLDVRTVLIVVIEEGFAVLEHFVDLMGGGLVSRTAAAGDVAEGGFLREGLVVVVLVVPVGVLLLFLS